MNSKLDKAISKLESQKNKEIEKISQINERRHLLQSCD